MQAQGPTPSPAIRRVHHRFPGRRGREREPDRGVRRHAGVLLDESTGGRCHCGGMGGHAVAGSDLRNWLRETPVDLAFRDRTIPESS